MWRAISGTLNPRVGFFFIAALASSPGNFHSSTAYLPSSFAMYMTMLGTAAFMNWRGGIKTSWGILWFAIGGVVGWPFAAALCAPFIIEEVFFACLNLKDGAYEAAIRLFRGGVATLIVAVCTTPLPLLRLSYMTDDHSSSMVASTRFSTARQSSSHGTSSSTTSFPTAAVRISMAPSRGHSILRTLR